MKRLLTRSFRIKPLADLPFYCHPVYLFVAIWISMLGALELQVSQATYDDRSMGVSLFIVSVLSMWMGFAITRRSDKNSRSELRNERYLIRIEPLRKIILLLGFGSMLLVIYNLIADGLPPVASFLGFQTMDYQEYGRFKQALQPMLSALFLNAMLESRWRRWLWSAFSLGIMVAYVLRGPLLMAMAQAVVLWSIRTSVPKRTIYIRAFVILCLALTLITVIGNYRTPQQIFFEAMQIKPEYRSWPMALLWPISYISVPVSNLCWIIHGAHFTEPTLSFLYPVLPSFWAPANPHDIPLSDSHVIDGVHTYLAAYYLDFSWIGIIAVNVGLGVISAYLVNRERISGLLLISPIFLSAIGLIFFWDFFIYLPTLGQLAIQAAVYKRCIVRTRTRRRTPLLLHPRPNPAT